MWAHVTLKMVLLFQLPVIWSTNQYFDVLAHLNYHVKVNEFRSMLIFYTLTKLSWPSQSSLGLSHFKWNAKMKSGWKDEHTICGDENCDLKGESITCITYQGVEIEEIVMYFLCLPNNVIMRMICPWNIDTCTRNIHKKTSATCVSSIYVWITFRR